MVCPKPGERVHRVSGISHKRNSLTNVIDCMAADERKSLPGADLLDIAEAALKCIGKLKIKGMVIERQQFFCPISMGRPYD